MPPIRSALALLALLGGKPGIQSLPHGPYAVGVTTTLSVDSSRMEMGEARPIQITMWYPARMSTSARVTYGHYLDLAADEKTHPTDSSVAAGRAAFLGFIEKAGVSKDAATRWLDTPMLAVSNAEPVAAGFPLILIVHGNGQSASDEASLGEYFASNGYVVGTMPSYTRISHPPASENDLGAGAEEQADDISFVLGVLSRRRDASPGRIGMVAHSLGARGALLFAMRSERVGALVSLDGGIGTATGRSVMENTPSFEPRRLSAGILHFYETTDSFMAPDFTLLRELKNADETVVRVTGMHHHHFADLGAWVGSVAGLAKATGATAMTAGSYDTMLDVARAFLDARLKGNKAGYFDAKDRSRVGTTDRAAFTYEQLDTGSR